MYWLLYSSLASARASKSTSLLRDWAAIPQQQPQADLFIDIGCSAAAATVASLLLFYMFSNTQYYMSYNIRIGWWDVPRNKEQNAVDPYSFNYPALLMIRPVPIKFRILCQWLGCPVENAQFISGVTLSHHPRAARYFFAGVHYYSSGRQPRELVAAFSFLYVRLQFSYAVFGMPDDLEDGPVPWGAFRLDPGRDQLPQRQWSKKLQQGNR